VHRTRYLVPFEHVPIVGACCPGVIFDERIAASKLGIENLLHPPFSKSSESHMKSLAENMNSEGMRGQPLGCGVD